MGAEFAPHAAVCQPTHENHEPVLAKMTNKNLFFVDKILWVWCSEKCPAVANVKNDGKETKMLSFFAKVV